MTPKEWRVSASGMTIAILVFMNAILLKSAYLENGKYSSAFLISVPLLVFAIWEGMKDKKRNAPES